MTFQTAPRFKCLHSSHTPHPPFRQFPRRVACHASGVDQRCSRRLLFAASGSCFLLLQPRIAEGVVTLTDSEGDVFTAHELRFSLTIVTPQNTITSQEILDFRTSSSKYCELKIGFRKGIKDIYKELVLPPPGVYTDSLERAVRTKKHEERTAANADLVMLGDQWLEPAIKQGALRPFYNANRYRYWAKMPQCWQDLVRRNALGRVDSRGEVYAIPAKWGCTVIAYRPQEIRTFGLKPIQDWVDLLQPRLAGKVAFSNSPRDLLCAAAKSMGLPVNFTTRDLRAAGISESDLQARLQALRKQVRVFSDTEFAAALQGKDVWAAVGPCDSIAGLASRSSKLAMVIPASGTLLFADLWAQPKRAGEPNTSPLIPMWVERGLCAGRDASSLGLQMGFMPHKLLNTSSSSAAGHPPALPSVGNGDRSKGEGQLLESMSEIEPSLLQQSDFALPMDDSTNELYTRLLESL